MAAVKKEKQTLYGITLLLMVGIGSLCNSSNVGEEFPIFSYSRGIMMSEGDTGVLFGQTVPELIPLLGYGVLSARGTEAAEDELTCRTLTTEDLISADIAMPPPEQEVPQTEQMAEQPENRRMTVPGGFIPAKQQVQIDLSQLTDYETLVNNFYAIDANTMAGSDQLCVDKLVGMDMTLPEGTEGPQILIYHTHSQEAFADSVPGDVNTGIVGVGEYLTEVLTEQYGYQVLHHTGQYDVETRDNAYSRALPEVEQILAQNPSIQVVIDLHRDEVAEGTRLVTEVEGRPTARFMFFNGLSRTRKTGNIDYLYNENQEANLAFSFQMQLKAAEYYPGLTRRIYLKGYRYNMHLCPRTLLVELGAQNNTVEEAKNACDPLAHILDMVLRGEA